MKVFSFKGFLHAMYAAGFVFAAAVAVTGLPYYRLPLAQRPLSPLHDALKPGGVWGHGLGIIGSTMVILLFLYSARKRRTMGLRFGRLSRWLDIHIFLGIMGPVLITLHTAMKWGGIVSISYYSMVAVALSGVFGRYLYMQIPRDTRGHALGLERSRERAAELRAELERRHNLPADVTAGIERFVAQAAPEDLSGIRAVLGSVGHGFVLRARARRLRRFIRQGGLRLPDAAVHEIVALAHEQSVLRRRIALLDTTTSMFHYWHVIHKPFAYVMIAIMIVHVVVAVSLGYRWVF